MSDTVITVVGNLTADPELRFVPSGASVANFTIASTPRSFNKDTKQWEDGEAMFIRVSAWRTLAENITNSLVRGQRVIVQGKLKARSYEKDGQKRTAFEIEAEEVGPSLKFASQAAPARAGASAGSSDPWG